MAVYEVIWEDGSHAIANYESDEEMKGAVVGHHDRAKAGEEGGPAGHPAGRIVKVLKYDSDPAESLDALSSDEAKAVLNDAVDEASEDGVLDLSRLHGIVGAIRTSQVQSDPHESNYKAEEVDEWSIEDLEGEA